jgi:hypothetical protein
MGYHCPGPGAGAVARDRGSRAPALGGGGFCGGGGVGGDSEGPRGSFSALQVVAIYMHRLTGSAAITCATPSSRLLAAKYGVSARSRPAAPGPRKVQRAGARVSVAGSGMERCSKPAP